MAVKFILFDVNPSLVRHWQAAFEALVPPEARDNITIVQAQLDDLKTPIDCIVSPANSFGRLDGGFDGLISAALAPSSDPDALTRTAQAVLYRRWRGYAPPGTCTLVPLDASPCASNSLGCRFLALCPTMRSPASVSWHREIVYNCVWSLLVAIDEYNAQVAVAKDEHHVESTEETSGSKTQSSPIETVVMTGLATGVGQVPVAVCAKQTALAFTHFHDAAKNPKKWSSLQWRDIRQMPLDTPIPGENPQSVQKGGITHWIKRFTAF